MDAPLSIYTLYAHVEYGIMILLFHDEGGSCHMSEAFDKLKELLAKEGTLSSDDIEKAISEHGVLTEEERVWLESEKHRLERSKQETVTMDQYLEALKVLDSAEEGSDEYKKAEEIVDKYEKGS
jgi:hypothetical protein